jgi:shikimate kinase
MRRHVFLVGARASGKTSAARGLASALGLGWTDTDARIQELLGESIAALVEREGWDAFRHRESAALRAVLEEEPMVVACGGGIVLREENRRMLARGLTLYLRAPAEVLAARLATRWPGSGRRSPGGPSPRKWPACSPSASRCTKAWRMRPSTPPCPSTKWWPPAPPP